MTVFPRPLKPVSFYLFIFLMLGITAGNFSADHKSLAFFGLVFFSIICLVFSLLKFKKNLFIICIAGLMFTAGFLGIQTKLYSRLPQNHIIHFTGTQKYMITGRISSFARNNERKTRYVLECQILETQKAVVPVVGKIHVSLYGYSDQSLQFGDIIQFKSKIKPIRNFNNPDGFDYRRFLKFQDIYGSAWADIKKIKVLPGTDGKDVISWMANKIETHRLGFYRFVSEKTQNSDSGKILISLVAGKKEILPNSIRDLFSKAGISHLLAISGLHLSIVAFLFFSFFYWVLSFWSSLLISGKAKKTAGLITLMPLIVYAVFTGFSPSTQRAVIMISVVLILFASEKQKDIISSLSIAGILILLMDAAGLFSISFQLSFMAVGCITAGLYLVRNFDFMKKMTVVSKIWMILLVTFFANLGTAPLIAYYFNMMSGVGIVSNLFLIPLIGFIVLPLGLISMFCFTLVPVLAGKIILICCKIIQFSIILCNKFIDIPFSWTRTVTPGLFELFLIYLFLAAIFFLLLKKKKLFLIIFIAVLAGGIAQFWFLTGVKNNKGLRITVLDVGQGNSALIQTVENQNILVDGGGFSGFSSFDTGRYIVAPFLWKNRIRHLDYVILTHPEGDHLNGLVYIMDNFKVNHLIKNYDQMKTKNYSRLIEICKTKGVQIWHPSGQNNSVDIKPAQLIFIDADHKSNFKNFNDNSLVFRLAYRQFSMLFTGDILKSREERLSGFDDINLSSDVLLAPHHGSRSSSSKFFLDKINPTSVIISCGMNNRYGFPHEKVLKRYEDKGIRIFRTDHDGGVLISSDGWEHTIKTSKGGS